MGDWDLLYIVTSAHWLPVTRSDAVISPKTGIFFCLTYLPELSVLLIISPPFRLSHPLTTHGGGTVYITTASPSLTEITQHFSRFPLSFPT